MALAVVATVLCLPPEDVAWQIRMAMIVVMLVAFHVVSLCTLVNTMLIVGRTVLGLRFGPLLPLALSAVLLVWGWNSWPQDIFFDEEAPDRTHRLVERLSDRTPGIRALALSALRNCGPYDEATATAVLLAMTDSNEGVRSKALSLTNELGEYRVHAVPILRACFVQHDGCLFELAKLGPIAKDVVPDLEQRLPISKGYTKLGICEALWRIDGNVQLVVPALVELLDDEFAAIKVGAARLLGQIGPAAVAAVSRLQEMASQVAPSVPPASDDLNSRTPGPRKMTDAEFFPQLRDAAANALKRIQNDH